MSDTSKPTAGASSPAPAGSAWIPVTQQAPPRDVAVETKIDDGRGVRNQTTLKLHGNLWFLPDMSMYVYYSPTHWRHLPNAPALPHRTKEAVMEAERNEGLAGRAGSGTAHLRSRDLCMPRIRPGLRVRFDNGKWDCCVNAVRHDPSWATKPWAMTQVGVTVKPDEFPGSIFPNNGPWGLPDFATPVRWDGFETVTWVRTSCLDVIDDENVIRSGQQVLLFDGGSK